MEIERKFLLDKLPDIPVKTHKTVYQGYLYTTPHVVRIRKSESLTTGENTYVLCIKSSGTLERHEIETNLTKEQFEELAGLLDKPLIKKDFYTYNIGDGLILECSIVDDGAFSYAEVEFDSREQALAWKPLEYLGVELTYKSGFTMSSYWENREVPEIF